MFRAAARFTTNLIRRYRMSRYDDFTIADYFRTQGAKIGDNCRILIRDLGTEPYLIRIGNHCTIAGGVYFGTHDGATWVFTEELPSLQRFGTVEVLDNCFIGYGAILMGNIQIGPNSVVGAGAVVTKNVPPNIVVAGCPAKPICTLDEYKRKVIAAWQRQKPPGYMAELRDGVHYAPTDIQKEKVRYAMLLRNHLQHLFRPDQPSQAPPFPNPTPPAPVIRAQRHPDPNHDEEVAGRSRSSE